MKLMNKLFAALVLFGMSNAAFGISITLTNKTNKEVYVALKFEGSSETGSFIGGSLPPHSPSPFTGPEGKCLERIAIDTKPISQHDLKKYTPLRVCEDAAFDITGTSGFFSNNFELSPAK